MCPIPTQRNGDEEMVAIDTNQPSLPPPQQTQPNGKAENGHSHPPPVKSHKGVYGRASDFLSNTSNWKIIESTLREGEQFANAFFTLETKIKIAKAYVHFCWVLLRAQTLSGVKCCLLGYAVGRSAGEVCKHLNPKGRASPHPAPEARGNLRPDGGRQMLISQA